MSVKKDIKAAKACDSAKTAEYQLRFGCPINEFCDHPAKTKKEMGRISAPTRLSSHFKNIHCSWIAPHFGGSSLVLATFWQGSVLFTAL